METVDERELLSTATAQFNIVLQFFPRADSKMSTLFGYNLGLLAFLGANAPGAHHWPIALCLVYAVALSLIGTSLVFVYKASQPTIRSSKRSMIFFNDIAAFNDDDFVKQFREEFRVNYVDDMLRQIWCNSEILRERFHNLQLGYKYLSFAIVPWVVGVAYSAVLNHYMKL